MKIVSVRTRITILISRNATDITLLKKKKKVTSVLIKKDVRIKNNILQLNT